MPPIYLGETQISTIYKGEAQLSSVSIGETVIQLYATTTTVPPTTVPPTTAYLVSGAGEIEVNGTYCYGGEFEGKPYYQYNSPELGVLYMFFDPGIEVWTIWSILETETFESYYNTEWGLNPPTPDAAEWYGEGDMFGWEIGTNPAPTVTQTTC